MPRMQLLRWKKLKSFWECPEKNKERIENK